MEERMDRQRAEAEAISRGTALRFLSDLFLAVPVPDRGTTPLESLGNEGKASRKVLMGGLDSSARRAFRRVLDRLADAGPGYLCEEQVRVFGHTASSACPPYESRYGVHTVFEQTRVLADIAGFYKAFGLKVGTSVRTPPDHLGVELEFLSFLSFKEAYALRHHGAREVEICRRAYGMFLREHPSTWVEDFCFRLERVGRGGLFEDAARALGGVLGAELRRLGTQPACRKRLSRPEGKRALPVISAPTCV